MLKWKDVSSFSKGDTDRTPKAWEAMAGMFRLIVHRHIHYEPDQWLLTCRPGVFDDETLKAKDIDAAKDEAADKLRERLDKAMSDLASR